MSEIVWHWDDYEVDPVDGFFFSLNVKIITKFSTKNGMPRGGSSPETRKKSIR